MKNLLYLLILILPVQTVNATEKQLMLQKTFNSCTADWSKLSTAEALLTARKKHGLTAYRILSPLTCLPRNASTIIRPFTRNT